MLPTSIIPIAISTISALVKYRERVDEILSIKVATDGLPFKLPTAPKNDEPYWGDMIAFFKSSKGQAALYVHDLQAALEKFIKAPDTDKPSVERDQLMKAYFAASGVVPKGPPGSVLPAAAFSIQPGKNQDLMLAYQVVESERLSRNPAYARLLLATADTLLEVAGANAGLFLKNPQTRAVVEAAIEEFAVKSDFDDSSGPVILKSMIGSAIVAAADHPGGLADKPAFKPLLGAITDVRKEMAAGGDDFVASIVSADGFTRLVGTYLTHTAADPSFITRNVAFQAVLKDTMLKAAEVLPEVKRDPAILIGVLETALGSAAGNVSGILEKKFGQDKLLTVVLSSVAAETGRAAQNNDLIKQLKSGALIPALFKTTLDAVAANPALIKDAAGVDELSAKLVAGVASALAAYDPDKQSSREVAEALALNCLTILASEPSLLGKNQEFPGAILTAVLSAAAATGKDGFSASDIESVAKAALKSAADNIGIVKMGDNYAAILKQAGETLAQTDFKQFNAPDTLLAVVQAVAANPAVWSKFREKDLVKPLTEAVLAGLSDDPSGLLSKPRMIQAVQQSLQTLALRGDVLISQKISNQDVEMILKAALARAGNEAGKTVDGDNLVAMLDRVLVASLNQPVSPLAEQMIAKLLDQAMPKLTA